MVAERRTSTNVGASQKKVWTAPTLIVYGSVQDITECNKEFGTSDGNTFGQNQQPIVCS